jgi:hypothetical protein
VSLTPKEGWGSALKGRGAVLDVRLRRVGANNHNGPAVAHWARPTELYARTNGPPSKYASNGSDAAILDGG